MRHQASNKAMASSSMSTWSDSWCSVGGGCKLNSVDADIETDSEGSNEMGSTQNGLDGPYELCC